MVFTSKDTHMADYPQSLIKSPEPILWLGDARNILRKLPSIDSLEPCIVVAGSPNVGKSALINSLSSGEPEVTNTHSLQTTTFRSFLTSKTCLSDGRYTRASR